MRKTSMSVSTLIALAGAAAMSVPGGHCRGSSTENAVQPKTQRPSRTSQVPRSYHRPGRAYPEQSSRQALRNYRRAQGGPGLVRLNMGRWIPRDLTRTYPKRRETPLPTQDD